MDLIVRQLFQRKLANHNGLGAIARENRVCAIPCAPQRSRSIAAATVYRDEAAARSRVQAPKIVFAER